MPKLIQHQTTSVITTSFKCDICGVISDDKFQIVIGGIAKIEKSYLPEGWAAMEDGVLLCAKCANANSIEELSSPTAEGTNKFNALEVKTDKFKALEVKLEARCDEFDSRLKTLEAQYLYLDGKRKDLDAEYEGLTEERKAFKAMPAYEEHTKANYFLASPKDHSILALADQDFTCVVSIDNKDMLNHLQPSLLYAFHRADFVFFIDDGKIIILKSKQKIFMSDAVQEKKVCKDGN